MLPGFPGARRPDISMLPDDIVLLIITFLDVQDILALRKTSKRFLTMSKMRWVWSDALRRHVISKGLPVPAVASADLKALPAEHLEARTVHATRFQQNWHAPHPVSKLAVEFDTTVRLEDEPPDPEDARTTVSHVAFLPGRNGEYLVTAAGRVLTLWEVPLGQTEVYRVAEWVCHTPIEQVLVNEDPKNDAVVALVCAHRRVTGIIECLVLVLDQFHGKFTCRMELRAQRSFSLPMHVMRGDYLILGDPLHVCFFRVPSLVRKIGTGPSNHETQNDKVLAVKIIHRYMLVIRQKSFEILHAPMWKGVRTTYTGASSCSAVADSAIPAKESVVVFRHNPLTADDDLPDWPSEPVTILSRSADGFDMIHQYDLIPNPDAERSAKGEESSKCDRPSWLPCVFPESYTDVLPGIAPSMCDMKVGPSGKGFWVETRNVPMGRSLKPARCLVGFDVEPDERGLDPRCARGAKLVPCHVLYARRCNIHEIMWKNYMIVSTAFEDTVGRIAVGDVTGKVEVHDLA